jgi:hypothetical protein
MLFFALNFLAFMIGNNPITGEYPTKNLLMACDASVFALGDFLLHFVICLLTHSQIVMLWWRFFSDLIQT